MPGVQRDPTARVGRGVRFDLAPGAAVRLGANVVVGDGTRFHVRGEVVIGDGTVLGERCVVLALERVTVGAGCRLADEVVLCDFAPRLDDVETPIRLQGLRGAAVSVGDGAVLGPAAAVVGARVLPGARVGARAVVGHPLGPPGPAGDVPTRD